MDLSILPKDEIWFLRMCHHILDAVWYETDWVNYWSILWSKIIYVIIFNLIFIFLFFYTFMTVHLWATGTTVAQWLRRCATNWKVTGSIPDGVIGIFHWRNPSDSTMDLGSTQPLTEMSTRRISWGLMRPVRKADNLTTSLCRCHEIWEP